MLRIPAESRIVERFNQYQKLIELTQATPEGMVPHTDLGFLGDLEGTLQLQKFREELSAYLTSNGLPADIANEDEQSTNFLRYYLQIIEDCPLVCTAKLDHVREVLISVIETKSGVDSQMAGYSIMIA